VQSSSGLYLGAIHFDGAPGELLPAYRRLSERFPVDRLDLHVCLVHERGITVLDACPSRAIFEEFTHGAGFLGEVSTAGLPAPRVDGLGDVVVAHLREQLR